MNINGLGSAAQTGSSTSTWKISVGASASTSPATSDTVTISAEALAALIANQQGADRQAPPELTDDMAAKMGADIKQQNADLFTQLDTDQDGTLNADEAKAGKDAIDQAIADGSLTPPKRPGDDGGAASAQSASTAGGSSSSASASTDLTAQMIAALHQQGMANEEIAKTLGVSVQKVEEALSSDG